MVKGLLGDIYLNYFPSNQRLERIWKLAQVDFKKRYYNDKFGMLWAIVNPISQMLIYFIVFTKLFNRQEENYILFLFGGIIMWMAFTEASNRGSHLLKQKRYLVENIQFDWMDLYYSHILSIMMGLSFNFGAYVLISFFHVNPYGEYWYLFPFVLLTWAMMSLACGILLGLVRTIFDDFIHIWNIFTKLGFWGSGIFFPTAFIVENYSWLGYINPFVGIIGNTRACLLVNNEFFFKLFFWDLGFAFVLYSVAVMLFYKYSKTMVEKL